MTAATTFTALLVLTGICVGCRADRTGHMILSGLFLATLAIIGFVLVGLGNVSSTSISGFWTFAIIVASFCIPMSSAYYLINSPSVRKSVLQQMPSWPSSFAPGFARNAVAEQ